MTCLGSGADNWARKKHSYTILSHIIPYIIQFILILSNNLSEILGNPSQFVICNTGDMGVGYFAAAGLIMLSCGAPSPSPVSLSHPSPLSLPLPLSPSPLGIYTALGFPNCPWLPVAAQSCPSSQSSPSLAFPLCICPCLAKNYNANLAS